MRSTSTRNADAGLPEQRLHLTAQQCLLGAAPAGQHGDRHRRGPEPDGDRRERGAAPHRQPDQRHAPPGPRTRPARPRAPRPRPRAGARAPERRGRRPAAAAGAAGGRARRGRGRAVGRWRCGAARAPAGPGRPRGPARPARRARPGRQAGSARPTARSGWPVCAADLPAETGERRRGRIGGDDARQPQLGAQLGPMGARQRTQLGAQLGPAGTYGIGVAIRHRHRLPPRGLARDCAGPGRSSEAVRRENGLQV